MLGQPGLEQLATQSRTKTARRSRVALKICSIRGRDVDDGRHNTAAQMFMASRATAAFAFIGRGYCPRQACGRKSMRLGMAVYTQIGGLGSRSRERRSGSCWPYFVAGMGCGVMGRLLWLESRCATSCLAMRLLERRENGSRDLDLSQRAGSRAGVEVGVCVAPEPLGLVEGDSNVSEMVLACTRVGLVAVSGCYSYLTVAQIFLVF